MTSTEKNQEQSRKQCGKRSFDSANEPVSPAGVRDESDSWCEKAIVDAFTRANIMPTLLQCTATLDVVKNAPALAHFYAVLRNNAVESDMVQFYDTALRAQRNTISVVIGAHNSGKTTKLRALVHALGGRGRFVTGDFFRHQLLAKAGIRLSSQHPMVVIARQPDALPRIDKADAKVLLHRNEATGRNTISCNSNPCCVAIEVDSEEDVVKLKALGLRLNILRLGPCRFLKPTCTSSSLGDDNLAVCNSVPDKHEYRGMHRTESLAVLRGGGVLFAAWRALKHARVALTDALPTDEEDF